jgi:hypothetical protein
MIVSYTITKNKSPLAPPEGVPDVAVVTDTELPEAPVDP